MSNKLSCFIGLADKLRYSHVNSSYWTKEAQLMKQMEAISKKIRNSIVPRQHKRIGSEL